MFESFYAMMSNIFGLEEAHLSFSHMAARAVFVYLVAVILTRANRRFMGVRTAFNFILNLIIASGVALGITGDAPFLTVIGVFALLAIINHTVSVIAFYFPRLGNMLKGPAIILVKDGVMVREQMHKNWISRDEIMEAVHLHLHEDSLDNVKTVIFESDGTLTVIRK